jgi:hypothetical protein
MGSLRLARFLVIFSMALLTAQVRAQDEKTPTPTPAADPDLPQPLNLDSGQPLLQSSPFTRALDLSDSLMLTGIAYVQGKPVATVADKSTRQSYLVSEVPNAQGWRLADASASNEPRRTQVTLVVGSEEVTIHYNEGQLTPTTNKSTFASRFPTEKEATRTDENGKAYISGSLYLSDADRDIYHKGMSKEAHDKFRQDIRDARDKMFSFSPEERAAFAKKAFDNALSEDKARGSSSKK